MPELDDQDLAARYGWSLAVLNSDPELKKVFEQAVANTWSAERFVAEVRNTKWFQNNSESVRQNWVLRESDPATYQQRLEAHRTQINRMAMEMGVRVSSGLMDRIAQQSFDQGWNQQQLQQHFSQYIKFSGDGHLRGSAGQVQDDLKAYAQAMGVRLSDRYILDAARQIANGVTSVEQRKDGIANLAASAYPHLRERFQAGETLAQIMEPYRQTMAQMLELSPEQLDAFDPTIRQALSGKDKEGKPAMKTIWEFENDLRKDKRWLKTNQAREQTMGVARQVLKDFGLQF